MHCLAHLQLVQGFCCYNNSAEREMSASACTRCVPGYYGVQDLHVVTCKVQEPLYQYMILGHRSANLLRSNECY